MTRKDELTAIAIRIAGENASHGIFPLGDEILKALLQVEREVWAGLKVDNEKLVWALKELGPTGTNAEAYLKAAVEYVIACRQQKELT